MYECGGRGPTPRRHEVRRRGESTEAKRTAGRPSAGWRSESDAALGLRVDPRPPGGWRQREVRPVARTTVSSSGLLWGVGAADALERWAPIGRRCRSRYQACCQRRRLNSLTSAREVRDRHQRRSDVGRPDQHQRAGCRHPPGLSVGNLSARPTLNWHYRSLSADADDERQRLGRRSPRPRLVCHDLPLGL